MKANSENLGRILELVKELPDLQAKMYNPTSIDYEGSGGTGSGLYKNTRIAVQRAYFPAGSSLHGHKHNEKEWLIIYSGKAEVEYEGKKTLLCPGDSVYFLKNQTHSFKAIENTWVLGVTVPASDMYPEAA